MHIIFFVAVVILVVVVVLVLYLSVHFPPARILPASGFLATWLDE